MTGWRKRGLERLRLKRMAGKQRHLVRVTGPDFVADLKFEGGRCIEAPERLTASVGRSAIELRDYFERRGWGVELVH